MKNNKKLSLIIVIIALIPVLLYVTGIGQPLEYKTIDWRFRLRGESLVSDNIFIAAIDDYSIQWLGGWPWSRGIIGGFINRLQYYPPRDIVLDILYTEPSLNFAALDEKFADAASGHGSVYFPFFSVLEASLWGYDSFDSMGESQREIMEKAALGRVDDYPEVSFKEVVTIWPPAEVFSKSAVNTGYVNSEPDSDGIYRRVPLLREFDGKIIPSISLSAALDYLDADRSSMIIKPGRYLEFLLPENVLRIPVDRDLRMLVNQRGDFNPDSIRMASFLGLHDYYASLEIYGEDEEIDEILRNMKESILLIGLTGTGTTDISATPFNSLYPMVGFVATALANIIEEDFLREVPHLFNILLIVFMGIFAGRITSEKSARHAALLNLLIIIFISVAGLVAFRINILISVFYPGSAIAISYAGVTAYRFATEEKEKRMIKGMFSRYVSSQIVEELMKSPETVSLGGSRKRLTVFFSDIRGFTTMSENLAPEEVVHILNEYLTEMIDIIFKYRGTLDKFMGDAVMAIWGAPVPEPDHAKLAVRAAWEMINKLAELQNKWVSEGKKPISVGMGINTGDVIIGNMGSMQFSDYTVIGDNVNLAARLEQNASAGQLILSESTYEEVKDIVKVNKLKPMRVKGKEKCLNVYEVTGLIG